MARTWLATAMTAAFAALAWPAFADQRPPFVPAPAPGEMRLGEAELRATFTAGVIACSDYHSEDDSCLALTTYSPGPDGALKASSMMMMSQAPRLEIGVWGLVQIRDDAVCLDLDSLDVRVLPNEDYDADSAAEASIELAAIMRSEIKPICSVYSRENGRLRERGFERTPSGQGKEIDPFRPAFSRLLKPGEAAPSLRPAENELREDES